MFVIVSVAVFENWVTNVIVVSGFAAVAFVPVITVLPSGSVGAVPTAAAPPSYGSLSCNGLEVPVIAVAIVSASSPQDAAPPKIVESGSKLHFAISAAVYLTMLAWIDFVEFNHYKQQHPLLLEHQ